MRHYKTIAGSLLLVALLCGASVSALAQTRPTERMIRTYVPPDQLVSFSANLPFDQFLDSVSPIFERIYGKRVIDPESRKHAIGVAITGMHFYDALNLVLDNHRLQRRETDRYFVVHEAPAGDSLYTGPATAAQAPARTDGAQHVTARTREIQIDAVLFEIDMSKVRDYGLDWTVLFGQGGASSGQGQSGTGSQPDPDAPRLFLNTERFFDRVGNVITGPGQVDMATVMSFVRFFETEGLGETVANPRITVQSGETGQIQIGSDLPVQIRDFAGNTTTQFVQTGVIVDVKPTLLRDFVADTVGAPMIDFIHLDVRVEKSGGRPMGDGIAIDKSQANTQVLLLDGEQTVIGGLFSTEESFVRRGVPGLKDLPAWFFGLRYVFGYTVKRQVQKELLIVLQARAVDPLNIRADRPLQRNLIEAEQDRVRETLERFGMDRERTRRMHVEQ